MQRSKPTPRRPVASFGTIDADDLWLGNFKVFSKDTCDVYPTTEPEPIGILNADGEMLCRPPRRIGFLPWISETDDTSASGTS